MAGATPQRDVSGADAIISAEQPDPTGDGAGSVEAVDGTPHPLLAGEVLVSSTVKDLVVGSGIEFDDRGVHPLKGIPGEWRLYRVIP